MKTFKIKFSYNLCFLIILKKFKCFLNKLQGVMFLNKIKYHFF